jgi:hypothetical protein
MLPIQTLNVSSFSFLDGSSAMSDRAVQDEIIGYLADASLRTLGSPAILAGQAGKATGFAHFLARRYYRDRPARSFRYSRRLRGQTGRIAAEVVDSEGFGRFLGQCVMGSLKSAQQVAQLARAHLIASLEPGPWWQDLLDYECAYFLQAATAEPGRHVIGRRKGSALSAGDSYGHCRRCCCDCARERRLAMICEVKSCCYSHARTQAGST